MANKRLYKDLGQGRSMCYVEGCGKIFKSKSNRAKHVRKKHPGILDKVNDNDGRRLRHRRLAIPESSTALVTETEDSDNSTASLVDEEEAKTNDKPIVGMELEKRIEWENDKWIEFNQEWIRGELLDPFFHPARMGPNLDKQTESFLLSPQTFHPTLEMMEDDEKYRDFLEYCGAHISGICKISTPDEWIPNKEGYKLYRGKIFQARLQTPHIISSETDSCKQDVLCCQDQVVLGNMSGTKFRKYVKKHHAVSTKIKKNLKRLEKCFWKCIRTKTSVYAEDPKQTSLFDEDCKGFNFRNMKLPLLPNTVPICNNKAAPKVTLGSWMSWLCFSVHDKHFGGMNYLHFGASKSWYAVPPSYGRKLEEAASKALQQKYPESMKKCPEYFQHKATLLSPTFMSTENIMFNKVDQEAGEIVVTFPYCYTQGYDNGYNCAESVTWFNKRWMNYGMYAVTCNGGKQCGYPGKTSDAVDLTNYIELFQPYNLDLWKEDKLMGHHPEHVNAEERCCGRNIQNDRRPSDRLTDDRDEDEEQGKPKVGNDDEEQRDEEKCQDTIDKRSEKAEIKTVQGKKALNKGQIEKALKYFTRALDYNPNSLNIYLYRTECFLKLQQYNDGINDCETILAKIDPKNFQAHIRQGTFLYCLNQFGKAKEMYLKALELDPGNVEVQEDLNNIIEYEQEEKKKKEAEKKRDNKTQ